MTAVRILGEKWVSGSLIQRSRYRLNRQLLHLRQTLLFLLQRLFRWRWLLQILLLLLRWLLMTTLPRRVESVDDDGKIRIERQQRVASAVVPRLSFLFSCFSSSSSSSSSSVGAVRLVAARWRHSRAGDQRPRVVPSATICRPPQLVSDVVVVIVVVLVNVIVVVVVVAR